MRNKQANKGKLTLVQMKAEVRDCRSAMLYHFSKTGKNSIKLSDSLSWAGTSVLLTQSSVDDEENHSREKDCTEGKRNEVFFKLMAMIRTADRKKLTYWDIVQNISSFTRGVGRTVESAFAFFGHALSAGTRTCIFNKITDNDKEGRKN